MVAGAVASRRGAASTSSPPLTVSTHVVNVTSALKTLPAGRGAPQTFSGGSDWPSVWPEPLSP